MRVKIANVGEELVLVLPEEFAQQCDWKPGDLLEGEIVDGVLKVVRSSTKHERAMEIARRGMEKYRDALQALAKT